MKSFIRTIAVFVALFAFGAIGKAQCVTNFSYTIGSGGVVTFTASNSWSTTTSNYYWSFGNGTFTNGINLPNTSTTYTTNQVYTVSLFVTDSANSGCNAWTTQTLIINGVGCNGNVNIGHVAGPSGLVNFYALLTNSLATVNSSSWSFGDGGTQSGSGGSATHTYSVSGLYTVTLSVVTGPCTYTASTTVSVTVAPCGINASFTYSLSSNGQANFYSTTTGAGSNATYYWFFGDGGTATGQNTSHNYNANAQYAVVLLVNDSTNTFGCQDSTMQLITITNGPCLNNTSFTISKDSTQNLTWNAVPNYPNNVSTVSWSWGDGSSSNGFYPSHTYSAAGVYTICVSSTLSCGSPTTVCWAGSIYRPAAGSTENGSMVTVNILNPNTAVGIKQNNKGSQQIKCYPSPVSDMLTIEGLNGNGAISIRIFNTVGKEVRAERINSQDGGKTNLDVSSLSSGIYYLQVESNGTIENAKLIKQ